MIQRSVLWKLPFTYYEIKKISLTLIVQKNYSPVFDDDTVYIKMLKLIKHYLKKKMQFSVKIIDTIRRKTRLKRPSELLIKSINE